jgi:hypothetical protein
VSNPQSWNRYSYVTNRPINFNDPTGHMLDDGCRTEGCNLTALQKARDAQVLARHNREAERLKKRYRELRRQDELFSLMFSGSGENGDWTAGDWEYYNAHRSDLWNNPELWDRGLDSETGWDLYALHANRLASHYGPGERDQFMRDFGLVFAGIPYQGSFESAAWSVKFGPNLPYLGYSNNGLNSKYIDSKENYLNQTHHHAGIFVLGYFTTPTFAQGVNFARDFDNKGDIYLGNEAATHSWIFSMVKDPSVLGYLISTLR